MDNQTDCEVGFAARTVSPMYRIVDVWNWRVYEEDEKPLPRALYMPQVYRPLDWHYEDMLNRAVVDYDEAESAIEDHVKRTADILGDQAEGFDGYYDWIGERIQKEEEL